MKRDVLWYLIRWRDGIIYCKQTESICVKKEDSQQGEDKIDTGEGAWKGNGDGKLCREKYSS